MVKDYNGPNFQEAGMRIGDLARATGVEVDTIRYYEKAGMLAAPPRQGNGYRHYGEGHVERLAFIRRCRALDMPLADIRRLLDFVAHPEADCRGIDQFIDRHLAHVRERLNSMQALERQLAALRARCRENLTAGECGILNELVAVCPGEDCSGRP